MPIKTFKTREEIPEAQRDKAFELMNGQFVLEEADPNAISPAAQTALDKERQRVAEEEKARKKAEKDLADLKRATDMREKGITEDQMTTLRTEDAEKRKPLEQRITELESQNRKLKLTDRVKALALHHGILTDRIEDAMLVLGNRTDLADGGDSIVVKDAAGKVTTEPIGDFLKTTFRKEKPWLYGGTGTSGDGSPGDTTRHDAPAGRPGEKKDDPHTTARKSMTF